MGDENSDEIIMAEIGRGMLNHANTRIAFRQMKALETIAAEIAKLANPVLMVKPTQRFDPNLRPGSFTVEQETEKS